MGIYDDLVLASGAGAYFEHNEAAGTTMTDTVGGTAGSYRGGFTLGTPGLLRTDPDTAVTFNGTTGYGMCSDRAAFDVGDVFSIVMLVNLSAVVNVSFVDKGAGHFIYRTDATGRQRLRRNSVQDIVTATTPISGGRPTFLTTTKNAAAAKLYQGDLVNGLLDVTGAVTDSTMVNNALELNIGAADAGVGNFAAGTFAKVAIFPTALSLAQIEQLFLLAVRSRLLGSAGAGA